MSDIASGRVIFLQEINKQLIEAYDSYIALLNEELNDTAGIAYNHGWRTHRKYEGLEARERIEQLKKELE